MLPDMNQSSTPSLPSREAIEKNTISYYRRAGGTRPDVRLVEIDGRRAIVKDYRHSDLLFRLIAAPLLLHQEHVALRQLRGIEGVPQILGRPDRFSLLMEHVPGVTKVQPALI